jgi:hypothetical protein
VYRALDVVVHASTQPEPFGLTIVEAMACGRAVVASGPAVRRSFSRPAWTPSACRRTTPRPWPMPWSDWRANRACGRKSDFGRGPRPWPVMISGTWGRCYWPCTRDAPGYRPEGCRRSAP